jgi:hypothetical protein
MAKGASTICDSYHEAQTDMNNFRRRVQSGELLSGGKEGEHKKK